MNICYVAGLFDGEGTARIFKKSRKGHIGYYVSVGIGMCYLPVIKMLYDTFGGHLNEGTKNRKSHHRMQYTWGLANQSSTVFLSLIRPHLIVKTEEVDLCLQLQDHIDQNPYKPNPHKPREDRTDILAYREGLYLKCKALKKQTFNNAFRLLDKSTIGSSMNCD